MNRFSENRPHPWHGLPPGRHPPEIVNAYIEITPFDLVKYEIDKTTGCLRLDRLQRTSSLPPTLYGFIPRTYCGTRVAKLSDHADSADEDPLDICVVTERPIGRAEMLIEARVIGVLRCIDDGRADDKIVAVIESDPLWGELRELRELPAAVRERLHHYFSTYKLVPGKKNRMLVEAEESPSVAHEVIRAAMADYDALRAGNTQPESQNEI